MSRRAGADCLSDLALDRLLLGELDASAQAQVEAHLAACAACRARCEAIERDRAAFVAAPPPLALPAERATRSTSAIAPTRSSRGAWLAAAGLAMAAAIAGIAVFRGDGAVGPPAAPGSVDRVATKGDGFELAAVIERGGHQTRARSGDELRPGDRVQLSYSLAEPAYLYVIGVDGTARANVFFPEDANRVATQPGREVELPFSLVIDKTPGGERFFGVACDDPRDPQAIARAVEAGGARAVVPGCRVSELTFEKRL